MKLSKFKFKNNVSNLFLRLLTPASEVKLSIIYSTFYIYYYLQDMNNWLLTKLRGIFCSQGGWDCAVQFLAV